MSSARFAQRVALTEAELSLTICNRVQARQILDGRARPRSARHEPRRRAWPRRRSFRMVSIGTWHSPVRQQGRARFDFFLAGAAYARARPRAARNKLGVYVVAASARFGTRARTARRGSVCRAAWDPLADSYSRRGEERAGKHVVRARQLSFLFMRKQWRAAPEEAPRAKHRA